MSSNADCGEPRSPAEARQTETQEKARERFLDALATGVSVAKAALAGGVSRATVYRWREADEAFAQLWDDAYEAGTDALEDEARRRAVEGTQKPVFYKGEVVGHVREYSDTLLAMQLNARRPEKYRTNHKVEMTGGVKITIAPDDAEL